MSRQQIKEFTFSTKEKRALDKQNSDKTILILPAYNWNATAVINMKEYKNKIRKLLDTTIYKKFSRDTTHTICNTNTTSVI